MARSTPVSQVTLLSGVTTVSTGTAYDAASLDSDDRNFMAKVSGTGAVSATVLVEVSNNNLDFITYATITLSGTTSAADGGAMDDLWQFVRGSVTAISGTSATVRLTLGG